MVMTRMMIVFTSMVIVVTVSALPPIEPDFRPGFVCPALQNILAPCHEDLYEQCEDQTQCKGGTVCCNTRCGCSCEVPVRPGTCPEVPPNVSCEDLMYCLKNPTDKCPATICTTDLDCPMSGQKCCSVCEGISICRDPITREGICPSSDEGETRRRKKRCVRSCDTDTDCVSSERNLGCCFADSCGYVCLPLDDCPPLSKDCEAQKCEFGHKKAENNCPLCGCFDPCENVKCGKGKVCQVNQIHCVTKPCDRFQAQCIDICSLGSETGPCEALIPRYFSKNGRCEEFIYGGCGGNENNFESEKECTDACGDICLLKPDHGPCDDAITRFFFNPKAGQCEKFTYGGCYGNRNNFESEKDCSSACGDICLLKPDHGTCDDAITRFFFNPKAGQCEKFTYGGCEGNKNNFESEKECILACDDICSLKPDPGTCKGHFPRFFYNSDAGQCDEFIYGGCDGNENNFESEKECILACDDICSLKSDRGPCKGQLPRVFYNSDAGQCEKFIYGGCEGNKNNFESEDKCRWRCGHRDILAAAA